MKEYLNYILITLFLFFIASYQFKKMPEFFKNDQNLFYKIRTNKNKIESLGKRYSNLTAKINYMIESITITNSYVNDTLKKYNKKEMKTIKLYPGYEVKTFKPINYQYNNKTPFKIYNEIIGNKQSKNKGSLNNIDEQVIRSYNTTNEKYTELQKHIKHLNSM